MSVPAVVFMVLTMGGVLGLNVLCLRTWLRGPRTPLGSDGPEAEDEGTEGDHPRGSSDASPAPRRSEPAKADKNADATEVGAPSEPDDA